ncbi:MAG: antibiotic biosynthesis monooxygenase [Lautropia sp.]
MIGVIFEVEPADGGREAYLARAATLRTRLEQIDGFVSVERFQSLSNPGKILSLSFFRDEGAVQAWRSSGRHRDAQRAGRDGLFADYRIRVVEVIRDYGLHRREQAPADSRSVHDPTTEC